MEHYFAQRKAELYDILDRAKEKTLSGWLAKTAASLYSDDVSSWMKKNFFRRRKNEEIVPATSGTPLRLAALRSRALFKSARHLLTRLSPLGRTVAAEDEANFAATGAEIKFTFRSSATSFSDSRVVRSKLIILVETKKNLF